MLGAQGPGVRRQRRALFVGLGLGILHPDSGGVAGRWKAVVTPFGMCATGRPGAPDVRNDWSAGFFLAMDELLNCKLESGGRSMLALVLEFRSN